MIRRMNWCARRAGACTRTLPAEVALEPGLVREIVRRFRLAAPLVDTLNERDSGRRRRAAGRALTMSTNKRFF